MIEMKKLFAMLFLCCVGQLHAQETSEDSCVYFVPNHLDWNHEEKLTLTSTCSFTILEFKLYDRWGELKFLCNSCPDVIDLGLQEKINANGKAEYKYKRGETHIWKMTVHLEKENKILTGTVLIL